MTNQKIKYLHLKLKKDVLIVDLPRICDYEVFKHGIYFQFENGDRDFIEGSWDLLCKGEELTEEQCEELVDDETFYHYDGSEFQLYKNYLDKDFSKTEVGENAFISPYNSFLSAISAQGYHWLVNPIEKPKCYKEWLKGEDLPSFDLMIKCKAFEEAESRTLKNPLIFIKKKSITYAIRKRRKMYLLP